MNKIDALIPSERGIDNPFLGKFMYAQRRMGADTQTYSSRSGYTEVPVECQPKSQNISFTMQMVSVAKEKADIVQANPSKDLFTRYVQASTVSFCIHPSALADEEETHIPELRQMPLAGRMEVMPTASSRTVAVLDTAGTPHALKCHLPLKISTFRRDLRPTTIRNSVAISRILDRTDIPHLPESLGVILPGKQEGEVFRRGFGFIVRELRPRPFVQGTRYIVPCFALYGYDMNRPAEVPLIVKLILRDKVNPMDYVLQHVMFPIIDDYAKGLTTQGVHLEAHGQNSLMEFDEQLNPKRIVHTDLDEYVDGSARKELGLSLEEGLSESHVYEKPTADQPHGSVASLIFDTSIGFCHFDPLAAVIQKHFGVAPQKLQEACRARFQKKLPDFGRFFTNTLYTYGYKTPKQAGTSYPLIPWTGTATSPMWRPQVSRLYAIGNVLRMGLNLVKRK